MSVLLTLVFALVISSIILTRPAQRFDVLRPHRRFYKYQRITRALFNVDLMKKHFCNPTPGPGEAMKNLEREIKERRRRAYRSSHRPRPR